MTHRTTIQTQNFRQKVKDQSGVSLLMAILVLASITAISFSLATIVLTEIKSSSDIVRSERALYASYAVTEEALLRYSRNVTYGYLLGADEINGVFVEAEDTQTNPMPLIDVIDPLGARQYNLIDSADPYGPGGYGSVRVQYSGSENDPLRIDLFEIDPVTGERTLKSSTGFDPLTVDGAEWTDISLSPAMQYDLQLFHDGNSAAITVTVYTYDGSGNDKGIPSFGLTFVDITASYLGLTRKYQTQIPAID